jgi:hypothetical protein
MGKAHMGASGASLGRWRTWAVACVIFIALLHTATFAHQRRGRSGLPITVAQRATAYVGPADLIAVTDAGLIPYVTRARTLDMIGLISPEVLEHPVVRLEFPRPYLGKHRVPVRPGVVDMVLSRRPVLIQTRIAGDGGNLVANHPLEQVFLQKPSFLRDYVYVGEGLFVRRDVANSLRRPASVSKEPIGKPK